MNLEISQQSDKVDWETLKNDLIADDFHNGRSTEQLERSFRNSFVVVYAFDEQRCIGTARALSDAVCNCYVVDVWTQSGYRNRAIASRMMSTIIEAVPGQHIYLQTDDAVPFYEKLGFAPQPEGLFRISGQWLKRT